MQVLPSEKGSVLSNRFTYIRVLNEEVFAGAVPLHRQHVALLLLTLPHQEVPVALQQLLDLQSGDGSVVPVLLFQRTVHVQHQGLHLNYLGERGKTGFFLQLTGITKPQRTEFREILQRSGGGTSKEGLTTPPFLHRFCLQGNKVMKV